MKSKIHAFGLLIVSVVLAPTPSSAQSPPRLDTRSQRIVMAINANVLKASKASSTGQFVEAGAILDTTINQIEIAARAGSGDLYDAMVPAMKRIINDRAMLELEGVPMAPFSPPNRPTADSANVPAANAEMPPPPPGNAPATPPPASSGISFVKQVAPILSSQCGGCHIKGSKGGFSLASFAVLMKGPPEGTVIFPGDTVGSRLIETIETGDMPRGGGKVSPIELVTLKKWIVEGAKFDGDDPSIPLIRLAGGGTTAPAAEMKTEMLQPADPTGKETVSFASDIAPILMENCNGCHINAMQTRGGLNMDTLARLFRGGDSGDVVSPGKGDASLLVRKIKGLEGDRMPAGGRSPLSDSQIQLISTWINEGATVPANEREVPLDTLTKKAWLAAATTQQITTRRGEIAGQHFQLAGADEKRLTRHESNNFAVWGEGSPDLLKSVANQAEAALSKTSMVIPSGELAKPPGEFFNGLASIYVLPQRYEYSEFAKMVERRDVPPQWQSHWKFDGIQAYVAMVASDRDDESEIASRLAAPVASLAVASRSLTVPRWFADGLGHVAASSDIKLDRNDRAQLQSELITAIGTLKSGKEFLDGKLPPERSDLIASAVCQSFLSRDKRRGFDTIMRNLAEGKPFDAAFIAGTGVTPVAYLDAWIEWVK